MNPFKVLRMSAIAGLGARIVWRVDLGFRGAGTKYKVLWELRSWIELLPSRDSRLEDTVTRGRWVRVLELGVILDAFGIEGGQQTASRPSCTPSRIWVRFLRFH